MNSPKIKTDKLMRILEVGIKTNKNILIKGRPGIGKTDIIKYITNKLGYDLMICHPVVDDPVDYKGFPFIVDGQADFCPYGNLRRMMEATKPLVVFFDDLGQAPQAVQAAAMQPLHAREINGKKISKHVRFVAATNSRKDNAGVQGLITPLLSRFKLIVELEFCIESWRNWAIKNNMPAELVSFSGFRPQLFDNQKWDENTKKWVDIAPTREIENFACPRTIAALGEWINDKVIDVEIWAGVVGYGFATEFYAFYTMFNELAHLPDAIIKDPDSVPAIDSSRMDRAFALTGALIRRANEDNFTNIVTYISRHMPVEMQTFFMNDVMRYNPELAHTSEYIKWSANNWESLR